MPLNMIYTLSRDDIRNFVDAGRTACKFKLASPPLSLATNVYVCIISLSLKRHICTLR